MTRTRKAAVALLAAITTTTGLLALGSADPASAATVPAPPPSCTATLNGSTATLTTQPTANNGGDPLKWYAFGITGISGTQHTADGNTLSLVWAGAVTGSEAFRVRAVNSIGFSTWTNCTWDSPPPTNQAPSVSAGADQSITLPGGATLNGTVTDDGLPAGSSVTQQWAKASGPGTVTFGDASAEDTTASFSTAGTYVLSLTATDGTLSSSDQMTVTVAPPVNQAPTVNAGADQSITLPSGANLNGTVTDDGLPSGTLTYAWAKVSGPGTVTFGTPTAEDTTATFSVAGTYVLKLTGSDGALSSSDQVQVTVAAAPVTRPYIPYSSSAWMKQTIGQLGLSQNSTKTSAMRTYINAHDPHNAPNIQGIGGQGWADAYGGISTCSDPYFKIGTGNKLVPFLGTTGFHAKATLVSDINNTVGTDLPFTVIDRCGNSSMPSGFVVKGTGAVTAGGAGTASNPYVINVGGYAGAYDSASNGLNFDVPTSNGPSNKTSRGVIPASAVIRADQIQYGIDNASDLGQRLEIFWWETDSTAGKISPPMAGFESGQAGWGAEGQVIGVNPAFTPAGTCKPGEQVVIRTLKTYGAYIGDNAGNGGTSLKAEQDHGQWTTALGLSQQGLANDCGLTWNDFVAY